MALSSHFPHTPLRTCSPGSPMSDGPSFFPQPLIYSHTLSPTTFPSIYINRQILQSELPLRGTLDAWHSENVERHSGKNQILSVTSYYVALSVSFILSKVVFSEAKTKQPKPQNQTQTKRPQAENPGRTVLGSKQEKLAQLWDSNKNQLWERLLSERSAPTTGGGGGGSLRSRDHRAGGAGGAWSARWRPQCPTFRLLPESRRRRLPSGHPSLSGSPHPPSSGSNAAVAVGSAAWRRSARSGALGASKVCGVLAPRTLAGREMGSGGGADTGQPFPPVLAGLSATIRAAPDFPGCLGRHRSSKQIYVLLSIFLLR